VIDALTATLHAISPKVGVLHRCPFACIRPSLWEGRQHTRYAHLPHTLTHPAGCGGKGVGQRGPSYCAAHLPPPWGHGVAQHISLLRLLRTPIGLAHLPHTLTLATTLKLQLVRVASGGSANAPQEGESVALWLLPLSANARLRREWWQPHSLLLSLYSCLRIMTRIPWRQRGSATLPTSLRVRAAAPPLPLGLMRCHTINAISRSPTEEISCNALFFN
jgi:hypothetical protein